MATGRFTTSIVEDRAVLPVGPESTAIDLASAITPREPPAPLQVTEGRKHKYDALLQGIASEQSQIERDGYLMRRLRWRQTVWSEAHSSDKCYVSADEVPLTESEVAGKWEDLDGQLPDAFRFHDRCEQMHLYWSTTWQTEECAVVRPTPSYLLKSERPEPQAGLSKSTDPPSPAVRTPSRSRTPSPLRRFRAALMTTAEGANDPASRKRLELMEARMRDAQAKRRKLETSASATPSANRRSPVVLERRELQEEYLLSISVYSRPLYKGNRRTRQHAAAEQRAQAHGKAGSAQQDHSESSRSGAEQSDEVPEDPIFQPRFAPSEADGEALPSQQIQMYSSQTVQDLRDAIICRLDDLPEASDPRRSATSRGAASESRYTGAKRQGHSFMLVEGLLIGESNTDLFDTLLSPSQQTKLHTSVGEALKGAQRAEGGLNDLRLADLPGLRLHRPYWYCHQGVCEHFWTIDEIRLPLRTDPHPPSKWSINPGDDDQVHLPPVYRSPLTTYLAQGALTRPVPAFVRAKAADNVYTMGACDICNRNAAQFALVGGVRVGDAVEESASSVTAESENPPDGETGASTLPMPPPMPSEKMLLCDDCLLASMGVVPSEHDPSAIDASSEGDQNGENGKNKRVRSGPVFPARKKKPSAPLSLDTLLMLQRGAAAWNSDFRGRSAWRHIQPQLPNARGWTVVPLLD